jgi:hypothetical protein
MGFPFPSENYSTATPRQNAMWSLILLAAGFGSG